MTTKDVLALALESLERAKDWHRGDKWRHTDKHEEWSAHDRALDEAITAIKQAQDGSLIDEGTKQQSITSENGNDATPLASAITAGNGQAQEPVKAIHQVYMGDGWKDKLASEMWMYTPEQGWESKYVRTVYSHPQATEPQAQGEAVSGFSLAAIGRKHWGNPIPQEWYKAARELLDVAHPQATEPQEAIAWEATTPVYTKYVTDKRYRSFSDAAKRWYKPYKCSSCQAQATEPACKQLLQVPEGYKRVPVEPTLEMCVAGSNYMNSRTVLIAKNAHAFYKAMLAAAPEAKQ